MWTADLLRLDRGMKWSRESDKTEAEMRQTKKVVFAGRALASTWTVLIDEPALYVIIAKEGWLRIYAKKEA